MKCKRIFVELPPSTGPTSQIDFQAEEDDREQLAE